MEKQSFFKFSSDIVVILPESFIEIFSNTKNSSLGILPSTP